MLAMPAGPFVALNTGTIDEYVRQRNEPRVPVEDFMKPAAWRAGADTLVGYPVEIVESAPSWTNGMTRTSGGVHRLWIEPSHLLVVKSTAEGNDGTEASRAEVTRLEFNVPLPFNALHFRPPKGSCDMGKGTPYPPDGTPLDTWRRQKCGP